MKPTRESAFKVAVAMSAVIPFFPKEEIGLHLVAEAMLKFVGTEQQLDWLMHKAIDTLSKYEGIPQLRGIFCSRFPPADGIEADPPGFTIEAAHAEWDRRVSEEIAGKTAEYEQLAAQAPPELRAPLALPPVETMLKPMEK